MHSKDGRFTIVFNGEIYNFLQLRSELESEGESFESSSDTEVLLRLYMKYGESCLTQLNGMFAFAIWDSMEQSLFLARDPLGIKPLYYFHNDAAFGFASEIRALLKTGLIPKQIDARALRQYLLFGSMQDPKTMVAGIESIPAGHWALVSKGEITLRRYWKPVYPVATSTNQNYLSIAREALEESVARHLVSDVPIGVFLSGGIDSTSLVAIMRRLGVSNIKTFSISFDDARFNEGDDAKRTADHFQTEHFDWRMSSDEGRSLMGQFLAACDSPSIDGFNTFCVSKLACDRGMKVVLSGLGGDEVFSGYKSFQDVPKLARVHQLLRSCLLSGPVGKLLEAFGRSNGTRRAGACFQTTPTLTAAYWAMRRHLYSSRGSRNCDSVYGPAAIASTDYRGTQMDVAGPTHHGRRNQSTGSIAVHVQSIATR